MQGGARLQLNSDAAPDGGGDSDSTTTHLAGHDKGAKVDDFVGKRRHCPVQTPDSMLLQPLLDLLSKTKHARGQESESGRRRASGLFRNTRKFPGVVWIWMWMHAASACVGVSERVCVCVCCDATIPAATRLGPASAGRNHTVVAMIIRIITTTTTTMRRTKGRGGVARPGRTALVTCMPSWPASRAFASQTLPARAGLLQIHSHNQFSHPRPNHRGDASWGSRDFFSLSCCLPASLSPVAVAVAIAAAARCATLPSSLSRFLSLSRSRRTQPLPTLHAACSRTRTYIDYTIASPALAPYHYRLRKWSPVDRFWLRRFFAASTRL